MRARSVPPPRVVFLLGGLLCGLLALALLALACGPPSTPAPAPAPAPASGPAEDDIAFYACPMHPSVRQATPGKCPLCGMDLLAVERQDLESSEITLPPEERQRAGVKTVKVERRAIDQAVRAVGKVAFDESRLTDVTVRVGGYVEKLFAETTGARVAKGQPLLTLFSPELVAAQEELLNALASQEAARLTTAPHRADYLVDATRDRLLRWGFGQEELRRLTLGKKTFEAVPVLAPAAGYVVEKNVVAGSAVTAGMRLFRLAELGAVWVEADLAEADLGQIHAGQAATVELPYARGMTGGTSMSDNGTSGNGRFSGKVAFVYPYLDPATRTGRVRIELANRGLELKPEMYANVEIAVALGEMLVVPEQAVLYAGERRFVFVDRGEGRLQPQPVEIGRRVGEVVEVTSGLAEGDLVVSSGNFLVAAESRLKQGIEQWP